MSIPASTAETPEEAAKREAEEQRLALEKQAREGAGGASPDGGIMDAIMGFVKFLFEIFFPNTEAPNEEEPESPEAPNLPEAPSAISRIGKLIVDAKAIPKWREFQKNHKGDKVAHQSPVAGGAQITSGFGHRDAPTEGASHEHKGVDFGARGGDANPDILASAEGVVLFSGKKSGYGNTVIVGHGDGTFTLYGHLTGGKMPSVGAEVAQGETIGVMGSSGTATGTHLHYEQRKGTEAHTPIVAGITLTNGVNVPAAAKIHPAQQKEAALAFKGGQGINTLGTVVIDAGHGPVGNGAWDEGAKYNGSTEAEINLRIAKQVSGILSDAGVKVALTHDAHTQAPNRFDYRTAAAKNANADVFVSIHADADPNSSARRGSHVVVTKGENDAHDIQLQHDMLVAMGENAKPMTHEKNLAVLRDDKHSSNTAKVLVETGFGTNPDELALLASEAGQRSIAEKIAKGILANLSHSHDEAAGNNTFAMLNHSHRKAGYSV